MARRKSSDVGSYIGWGIAAVAGYWLYSNWSTLSATLTNAVTGITNSIIPPVTTSQGGIVPATPVTGQALANMLQVAQVAQQEADEATAAGNPNAPLLQTQAANLATAAALAQVPTTTTALSGLNRRYYRRRIA